MAQEVAHPITAVLKKKKINKSFKLLKLKTKIFFKKLEQIHSNKRCHKEKKNTHYFENK